MMEWQRWVPNRKVTAGAMAAAAAFMFVWLLNEYHTLTAAESFALGSAVAVVIAYFVPERNGDGG